MIALVVDIFRALDCHQRKIVYFLLFCIVLMALLETLSVFLLGSFISIFLLKSTESGLGSIFIHLKNNFSEDEFYIIFIIFIFICSSLISFFTLKRVYVTSQLIGANFSERLLKVYSNLPYSKLMTYNSSELLSKMGPEVTRATNQVITPLLLISARITVGAVIFFGLVIINPLFSLLIACFFLFIYGIIFSVLKKKLARNDQHISILNGMKIKIPAELFKGIREIKLFGFSGSVTDQYSNVVTRVAGAQAWNSAAGHVPRYLVENLIFVTIVVCGFLAVAPGAEFQVIQAETLAVYGASVLKLLPSIQQIYSNLVAVKSNHGALSRTLDHLRQFDVVGEHKRQASTHDLKPSIGSACFEGFSFDQISFQYEKSNQMTLNDLTFNIKKNDFFGIIGGSGSGKSTILNLILGFLMPNSGKVILETDRTNFVNSEFISRIGLVSFVPQDLFLMDTSILENICLDTDIQKIDRQRLKESLDIVDLTKVVDELEHGVLTRVGEHGMHLSGGQKQRIGIARAIYNKSPVLVLDEATSALDHLTERKIVSWLESGDHDLTVIMVTHNVEILERCDKILVIEEGRVSMQGNFLKLQNESSLFRSLLNGG